MKLLLLDNYDSFTYNVMHLFAELGARVEVLRNDDSRVLATLAQCDAVIVGPGPGRPSEAGQTMQAIATALALHKPLLGVCLGQQAIGEFFGGVITHAPSLMHGKTSEITHDASGIFAGVPSPFRATRYHSLCVAHHPFPAVLRVTASSEDGVIQGLAHRELPVYGVQFHPESVLTPDGRTLAANFLASL